MAQSRLYQPKNKSPQASPRKQVQIVQNKFDKGYVSVLASSRIPNDAVADLTNIDVVQDSILRPRPPLVAYGPAALGTIIGIGTFVKLVAGQPQKWQITMQVIGGVGQIVINKDGGAWSTIGGTYDASAWCQFTQSNSRVYVSNGVNTMSYYDINAGTITTYSALPAPSTPTLSPSSSLTTSPVPTGSIKYYYGISANNATGETAMVMSASVSVNKLRDNWVSNTDSVTVTGTSVTGATSYNIYISTDNIMADFQYLTTINPGSGVAPVFTDDGTAIINIFKAAPAGDSTSGPKLTYLINDNGQLFGVGDPSNPYYMWYSGAGTHSGDFSPFNGGGFAYINYGGDSIPTVVKSFRDGKGNPVVTVLTRGQGGAGRFYHAQYSTTTYGNVVIPYYNVYEANGQSGTIAPFGVVEANNNLYYPTGDNFKSTGSAPNVFNILATQSVSQAINPDEMHKLNLTAMSKCVGLYYRDRIFWAVPNGSTTNNEIWITDLGRNGLWILRWTVPATWLWLYEDNSGVTYFCALVNNQICYFDYSYSTQTNDLGVPFSTRIGSGSIVWDSSGVSLAAVQQQIFKFFYPKGSISVNNYGLGEDITAQQTLSGETYTPSVSFTGFDTWDYSGQYSFDNDPGLISSYAASLGVVTLEPDETLNEINWEVVTNGANCDYTLSTVTTIASAIPNSYVGSN